MQASQIPAKFPIAWGADALNAYIRSIPIQSQIGQQNGAASLTDGFPPLCFTPESAGGTPPFGQDFNGILRQITQWLQWVAFSGIAWDSTYSGAIGGYPKGAVVQSNLLPGRMWLSTLDNNTNDPDAYPFTGWITLPGQIAPGTPIPSFQVAPLVGSVLANGLTIGNVGSGGTTPPTSLASASAFFLFCSIWLQFPQTLCPVQFNGVSVTRNATPLADWQAGRVIVLPNMNGAGIIGQDSMSGSTSNNLNNVPVQSGSLTTPGSIIGENLHALIAAQIPALSISGSGGVSVSVSVSSNRGDVCFAIDQTSTGGGPFNVPFPSTEGALGSSGSGSGSCSISGSTTNAGGGFHNTVERNFTVAWNLSL